MKNIGITLLLKPTIINQINEQLILKYDFWRVVICVQSKTVYNSLL